MAENKPMGPAAGPAMAGAARPGVLSLNIRERAALYAAYMPFLKGGGIFIPTSRQYQLGEEVFMLLSLMDDPNRIAVQGKVVWITPEGVQGNRQVPLTRGTTSRSSPQLGARPKARKKSGGPSPWVVVGAALAAGIVLAKWIDWRGHAHPRD